MSEKPTNADAVVIGAGIMGLTIALELTGRGWNVTVADRGAPGSEASVRNAGGVRQQGRAFPELALAALAVERWQDFDGRIGGPTGYRQIGHVVAAQSEEELMRLRGIRETEREHGLVSEMIDGTTLHSIAPALNADYIGGKFCATDGMAVPALVMQSLLDAVRKAGVQVLAHSPVTAIDVVNGAVGAVHAGGTSISTRLAINAAGPWSPGIAALADVYIPVAPSRTHLIRTVPLPDRFADVWVATAGLDFNGVQWLDNSLVFGAAMAPDASQFTYNPEPNFGQEHQARVKLSMVAPRYADVPFERRWTGVREYTPDMLPIIGPADAVEGLFLCTGFSGHGFALGPIVGALVAEWLATGRQPDVLRPFAPERFRTDRSPFNYPFAPWGGATTQIAAAVDAPPPEISADNGPLLQHGGAPELEPSGSVGRRHDHRL